MLVELQVRASVQMDRRSRVRLSPSCKRCSSVQNCFTPPLSPGLTHKQLGECQRNYIAHPGITRVGSIPLFANVQTANHLTGWGRGPNCFFTLVAKAKHIRQMLVEIHFVVGSSPTLRTNAMVAQLVEHMPFHRPLLPDPIPPWRMLVGTTFWMSRSWVRIPLLLPWRDSSVG